MMQAMGEETDLKAAAQPKPQAQPNPKPKSASKARRSPGVKVADKPKAATKADASPKPTGTSEPGTSEQGRADRTEPEQASPQKPPDPSGHPGSTPGSAGDSTPSEASPATAGRKVESPEEILGQVVSLFMGVPKYQHLFLADLAWRVLPALRLRQIRLLRQPDAQGRMVPVAYASWAHASEEVARRLTSDNPEDRRLKPEEWRSGDKPVIVDLVAQTQELAERIRAEVVGNVMR